MRRGLIALVAVLMSMILVAAPAKAITGNYVEDFEHPFVGLVVFYDANGEFSHRCSGSLLTPLVFLTAGHCTDGATTARVYFQQDAGANYDPETGIDPKSGYPETCLSEPCATSDELYNFGFSDFAGFPNTQDVGLVILDEAVAVGEYGSLAAVGTLDTLAKRRGLEDLLLTVSGYGLTESNPQHVTSFRERLMATSKIVNTKNALTDGFNLQATANRGGGKGGTCSGDSGGPVFYPSNTNVIVAVTSFGLNAWCRGTDFAYRTDQQAVIDWIFATVPASEVDDIQIVQVVKSASKRTTNAATNDSEPADTAPAEEATSTTAVTTGEANLLAKPRKGAEVVEVLPAGTTVTVTGPARGQGDRWVPVVTEEGVAGFIAAHRLEA